MPQIELFNSSYRRTTITPFGSKYHASASCACVFVFVFVLVFVFVSVFASVSVTVCVLVFMFVFVFITRSENAWCTASVGHIWMAPV